MTPLTLLIRKLAAIHAAEPALHGGRYQELLLTNRQYAFARHGDHQAILTAANNDDNAAYLQVPLPFHTTAEQATDLITGKSFLIDKNTNKIQIELEGNSAVILRNHGGGNLMKKQLPLLNEPHRKTKDRRTRRDRRA